MMHQLADLNHRHEQIINWLIVNPDRPLGECAKEFGFSQPWLSQIIHSDMFQARYRERCEEVGQLAVHTIHNRLAGVTALALEKVQEKLVAAPSEKFLGETLRTTLSALGYASGPPAGSNGHTVVNVQVNAQALVEARERAALAKTGVTEVKAGEAKLVKAGPSMDELMEAPAA